MSTPTERSPGDAALLRRVLFVSRHYSSDFSTRVGGIYQRLRMLLEAAAISSEHLDVLFFADQKVIDDVGPGPAQQSLLTGWNVAAHVVLAPRASKQGGPLRSSLRPIINFRSNDDFYQFNGAEQVDAIRAQLKPDTDLILVLTVHPAAATFEAIRGLERPIPVMLDINDIDHRTQARMWRRPPFTLGKALRFFEYPALARGELATIAASRTAFVCSSEDREILITKGLRNIAVIPNSARFSDQEPTSLQPADPTLFFIGTYSYPPNREAAYYLASQIFPLVRDKCPEVRLLIAGEGSDQLTDELRAQPGVSVVGFVADLDAAYRSASVVCCPILVGGGTRVKIIEAATRKRPVVSTTIGAEGLAFKDGSEIILRDSPESFAAACLDLLRNPIEASALGEAAYCRARIEYDRSRIIGSIAAHLTDHRS